MGQLAYSDAIIRLEQSGLFQSGLFLMPAGLTSRHAADLITVGFRDLLSKLSREFDLVVVDAPPMLAAPESQELAAFAESVMLVTKASATSGKQVSQALSVLRRVRANVVGLVMNQVKYPNAAYYYYGAPETPRKLTLELQARTVK